MNLIEKALAEGGIQECEQDEVFDFSSPEDVLIHILAEDRLFQRSKDWKGFSIEGCTILNGKEGVTGAASYEYSYGGCLEYTLEDIIDCPRKEGFFVVEGVTATYHKGDGWTTDDDMDFYYVAVRPATPEEEAMF